MRERNASLLRLIGVFAVLALVLGACEQESAGPEAGVTVEELQGVQDRVDALEDRLGNLEDAEIIGGAVTEEEFDDLLGTEVTVSGEVSALLEENEMAFRVGGDFWSFDEGVLVVSSTGEPFSNGLSDGEVVQVTGTAMVFTIAEFENDYGVDLDDELFVDLQDEVAIAADPTNVDSLVPFEGEGPIEDDLAEDDLAEDETTTTTSG